MTLERNQDFIKEIRIYYECLEQAYHFVYPVINTTTNNKIPIKLVKLKKSNNLNKIYSVSISEYLFWKYPDVLVSIINSDNKEIPVFVIEFSTAVFTEDHELQRFDGMAAAAEKNIIFIKISPTYKKSEFQHGGKTDFDYEIPFALIYKIFKQIPVHIEWPSNEDIVEVDENYLSCPKDKGVFQEIVKLIFNSLTTEGINNSELFNLLSNHPLFSSWVKKLQEVFVSDSSDNLEKSIVTMLKRKLKTTSRIDIDEENRNITIKFNRFGHAMDPERGMLTFYSLLFRSIGYAVHSKMVFKKSNNAWYSSIAQENQIKEYIDKIGLNDNKDYLYILWLGIGLSTIIENFEKLLEYKTEDDEEYIKLDITKLVIKEWNRLNKPLRTIVKYSDDFLVEDEDENLHIVLSWKKDEIKRIISFNNTSSTDITRIGSISEIDEDLVTYIAIHNILKPQGYKVLAASYPGAQGDRVILIEKETGGRRQERRYVDIIVYSKDRNISALQSNKGRLSNNKKNLNKEIEELSKFKKVERYKEGLQHFFERFEKNAVDSLVKIGVGFWNDKNYGLEALKQIKLEELDYFIFITKNMKKWKVFECKKGSNLLEQYEGEITIPEIYAPLEKHSVLPLDGWI